jgi:hypothetical protein
MGMYNDFRNVGREDWKYTYAGEELLEAAQLKRREFRAKEEEARQKMSQLMQNMSVSAMGTDVEECKKKIAQFGNLREQCDVFVHEFVRTPEREFHLSLGDVTFFGLQEES